VLEVDVFPALALSRSTKHTALQRRNGRHGGHGSVLLKLREESKVHVGLALPIVGLQSLQCLLIKVLNNDTSREAQLDCIVVHSLVALYFTDHLL
jgi:hypothetical protein